MSSTFDGLNPPYATVVVDPPWPYSDERTVLQHNPEWRGVEQRGYGTMAIVDLCALPISEIVAKDAHLYVWTTNAFMVEAHDLARAWGFKPKTILTWVKTRHDDPERVSMKTGYWFRGATEHVVFAVRGTLRLQTTEGVPTAFLWPRISNHSVKPSAFGDLVEKASPGPYVELFARAPRLGWDAWGNGYEIPEVAV